MRLRPRLNTIRARILVGLGALAVGLVITAATGAAALGTIRQRIGSEMNAVRAATAISTGILTTVFTELRAAEQYLAVPEERARTEFQDAADSAFQYERRLEQLGDLTVEDRLVVSRIKLLQASIQVDYAFAHALRDLGRDPRGADTRRASARTPSPNCCSWYGDCRRGNPRRRPRSPTGWPWSPGARQLFLWLVLAVFVALGAVASMLTVRSVEGPLSRLVTAAERFGAGDLRPVTTGAMPREFQVLAHALRDMAERLRGIVREVIGESDRITTSAGDLSAVSEQLAASSSEVSTAMVDISGGAELQRNELTAIEGGLDKLRRAAGRYGGRVGPRVATWARRSGSPPRAIATTFTTPGSRCSASARSC